MNFMNNQMMGYDRSSITFAPDGSLIQVEYAKKTVKQGSTAIGIVCKDGILVVIIRRNNTLIADEFNEKIMQIDNHIGCALSGLLSDGRLLVERAQLKAQQHRLTFDTEIDVRSIVSHICQEKQAFTQLGGLRPFGVSVMIAGIDDKPRLYVTEPMGIFYEYKAAVIGEGEDIIKGKLEKGISKKLSIKDGLSLCIKLIRNFLGKKFSTDKISAFYIKTHNPLFTIISKREINNAS